MDCFLDNAAYSIAGFTFFVKGRNSLKMLKLIQGFYEFETDCPEDKSNFIIELDADVRRDDFKVLYEIQFENHKCKFGKGNREYFFTMKNDVMRESFIVSYQGCNVVRMSEAPDCDTLRFAMWFAFNMLASHFGAFGVHSSCITYEGNGVMFLGESGTGKSTHTRLWYENFDGIELLNDDSPIVVADENGVKVCGSPWSGKTPCFHNVSFPLAAVVRLRQAPENKIKLLDTIEAIAALFPSFPPAFANDKNFRDTVLQAISQMIMQVPVYQLDCLPDVAAAELSRSTIFK